MCTSGNSGGSLNFGSKGFWANSLKGSSYTGKEGILNFSKKGYWANMLTTRPILGEKPADPVSTYPQSKTDAQVMYPAGLTTDDNLQAEEDKKKKASDLAAAMQGSQQGVSGSGPDFTAR